MRAIVYLSLVCGVVGGLASGCGNVTAKPDAGSIADAGPTPDASGCDAGSLSCGADDALYQCDEAGGTSTKVQDCQYGCAVDHCRACEANTSFCSGDDFVMCDAGGMIVNPQTCAHGCQMDRCNTCDPGVAYCDGATAITCGADGEPGAMMSCGTAGCSGGVCNSCTPNTTSCDGDTLVVCNANGTVQSATSCALGCGASPSAHCKVLVPSYGIPAPSGTLPDLVVDAAATLDLTNCSASPSSVDLTIGGTTMSIVGSPQVLVKTQSGGPPICIVRFGSISISSSVVLTVINSASTGHVLSLQAVGDIQIDGTITFTNEADGPSPGGTVSGLGLNANNKLKAPGGGGAGAARAGGAGGACVDCNGTTDYPGGPGGAAVTNSTAILNGGSTGGDVLEGTVIRGVGGRGGGGLHLVSLTRVTLPATGRVVVNGRGGTGPAGPASNTSNLMAGGGGSGGTIVVEAPLVSLSAGGLALANGAGGAGGCFTCKPDMTTCSHKNGFPGQLSMARAAGGDCPGYGDGGYEANGTTTPAIKGSDSDAACATAAGGAGGGSNGFVYLRGRTPAAVMIAGGAIVSPSASIGAVTAN